LGGQLEKLKGIRNLDANVQVLLSFRPPGSLVRVPLGKREVLGIVWNRPSAQPD
jgi:primosomal protein N'